MPVGISVPEWVPDIDLPEVSLPDLPELPDVSAAGEAIGGPLGALADGIVLVGEAVFVPALSPASEPGLMYWGIMGGLGLANIVMASMLVARVRRRGRGGE